MATPPPPKNTNNDNEPPKKLRSPPHIFDNELYESLNGSFDTQINDRNNDEEKSSSFDFSTFETSTFSIEYDSGIFCCRWSPDGSYLAVGCADGGVRILNALNGKFCFRFSTSGNMPVTSMKWKTSLSGVGSSSMLMTTSSSGCIDVWHVESQKCIYSIQEENNQIFAFDIAPKESNKFASAGKDQIVRIYDDCTKKLVTSLEKGLNIKNVGHSNRIFALKWKPDDSNILMSGGWDNCVLLWDLRSGNCFRSMFGPHIAGQTIDIQNDIIVCGSWRIRDTIECFEYKTGKQITDVNCKINWKPSPMIYGLSYSPVIEGLIAAGGTGINQMRIINIKNGMKSSPVQLNNKLGIYCLDWHPKGDRIAMAGCDNDITIVNIAKQQTKLE